ncbi:MAG: DUF4147 domain-containing protein [Planctomycetes bacterium]|nr:DUF4147 domain-containing protein [Planctomycetota bacterium]
MKQLLRDCYAAVLRELDVRRAFAAVAAPQLAALGDARLLVIAFGKAARPMAAALLEHVDASSVRGLVVPPTGDDAPLGPFEVLPGGHPLPDAGSLAAGARALQLARSVAADEHVVFLVSGGGSAMLELPADPAVTLDDLRVLNRALVGSGADIHTINTVRRHLSALKGGRLARAAAAAPTQLTLAISDVPDARATSLASGPTVADPTTLDDCRAVLDRHQLWPALPAALRERCRRGDLPPPLTADDPLLRRSAFVVLLDEAAARNAAVRWLAARDIVAVEDQRVDDWPCGRAAEALLRRLDEQAAANPGRTCAVVSSGELSVQLPAAPGRGGRNQQFALECALRFAGGDVAALSCGTDGIDGDSPAAGAVADGDTVARAAALGLDSARHLARCDAYPLFERLGDAVVTGPSGMNVRDLRILLTRR